MTKIEIIITDKDDDEAILGVLEVISNKDMKEKKLYKEVEKAFWKYKNEYPEDWNLEGFYDSLSDYTISVNRWPLILSV